MARLAPKLRKLGITRVANVAGLDYVGIPVAMSVRPNSLNLSTYQGKGLSTQAAKVSAIMECYEHACAEKLQCETLVAGSAALRASSCTIPAHLARRPLRPDVEIPWVVGMGLVNGARTFLPAEAITSDYRVPRRPGFGFFRSNSNGLASGNTDDEAILHALCELVERDALALWYLMPEAKRAATLVDPRGSPDDAVHWLLDCFEQAAIQSEVWEVTSDFAVPTYFCVIDDSRGQPPFLGRFAGSGCHPNAGVAICRALTEAAQSRLTFIVGTRDDIPLGSYSLVGSRRSVASLLAPTNLCERGKPRPPCTPSIDTGDISTDVAAVLARLQERGVGNVVGVSLGDPDCGLPCHRLVCPDLEDFSLRSEYRPGRRARDAVRVWN